MAVTTRTVTRAIGNIDCQCHFVGYLLKYDAGVDVFQHLLICMGIEATCSLFLAWLREVADALQITDDTGHVVDILRMAVWALFQVALINMPTIVTNGIGNVESKIVASFLGSNL